MITHIRTVGFKGFDLDEDIPLKVIYSGKNKSGKSTRAGAISIALCGHIPFSTAGKRPGDILDSFGSGTLISAVTVGGKEFGRKFSRNEKGVVSQTVQVDKKRVSTENFAILLDRAGGPRIADVAEFMKQSAAKKVDTLFDLFPNPELSTIDTEIEKAKADVSQIEKKKTGAESTVQRLTNSKQSIQIPAGTIAAVQAEIKTAETQIADFEEQIKQSEIEEAEIKAKAQGKQEEKERADKEAEDEYFGTDPVEPSTNPVMVEIDKNITGMEKQLDNFKAVDDQEPFHPGLNLSDREFFQSPGQRNIGADSIQRIIEALNGAGCGTCAALIVAKQELKKFKGVS